MEADRLLFLVVADSPGRGLAAVRRDYAAGVYLDLHGVHRDRVRGFEHLDVYFFRAVKCEGFKIGFQGQGVFLGLHVGRKEYRFGFGHLAPL